LNLPLKTQILRRMAFSILLNGANGRMGQAIAAVAAEHGAVISVALDAGDSLEKATAARAAGALDVAIDFSHHTATLPLAQWCAEQRVPLVIGTTGHTAEERAAVLDAVAGKIPVVWAGNYSVGVTVLNHLVKTAARVLDDGYDIELVEMHHHHKKDAPSGTAEKLLQILRDARGLSAGDERHGRHGLVGARTAREIGVHALRGGDVVGDHTVIFAGDGERVELTHKASNRSIFAHGAIRAALWLLVGGAENDDISDKPPAVYGMEDVLNLG
jgi:4-hydroxy-tetrahydrodipicolinate reductase